MENLNEKKKVTFDFQWVFNRFKRNMAGRKNRLSSNCSSNEVMLTLFDFHQPNNNQRSFRLNFLDNCSVDFDLLKNQDMKSTWTIIPNNYKPLF